jgi:hypothetical protein
MWYSRLCLTSNSWSRDYWTDLGMIESDYICRSEISITSRRESLFLSESLDQSSQNYLAPSPKSIFKYGTSRTIILGAIRWENGFYTLIWISLSEYLVVFKKTIAIYCESIMESTNLRCVRNVNFVKRNFIFTEASLARVYSWRETDKWEVK